MTPQQKRRLLLISKLLEPWKADARQMPLDQREEIALMMAATFPRFRDFAALGMQYLGFELTDMQADICDFMQDCPNNAMVAAQRGEAKSTLAALFAVWSLVHNQACRILIVSGGQGQASEVAMLIIRLIQQWGLLCYLRPDKNRGDRTAYDGFDVHTDLKPLDKSASVTCVGITGQLQGKRADLLIPDDIETTNNGLTATGRETLLLRAKDFAAINTHGKTLYLGTPQTKDSIYNTLERRGFTVRVWPGRVPTVEEAERYGATLAPYVQALIDAGKARTGFGLMGDRGEVTDPGRYGEDDLISKELDFGPEGFQLQYMLDTSLSDAMRTRLKLSDMMVADFGSDAAPDTLMYSSAPGFRLDEVEVPQHVKGEHMYRVAGHGDLILKYQHKVMVIDPAGCGGDEVAFAAGAALNSYVHCFSMGGLQGGMTDENCAKLLEIAADHGIIDIVLEANMGHGTASMLMVNAVAKNNSKCTIRDVYSTTKKERRIIDTLGPILRRHKFVLHKSAMQMDTDCTLPYGLDKRRLYSGLFQLQNITYETGSLSKDDRVDALAMMAHELRNHLAVDETRESERLQREQAREFIRNPMGYATPTKRTGALNTRARLMNRR